MHASQLHFLTSRSCWPDIKRGMLTYSHLHSAAARLDSSSLHTWDGFLTPFILHTSSGTQTAGQSQNWCGPGILSGWFKPDNTQSEHTVTDCVLYMDTLTELWRIWQCYRCPCIGPRGDQHSEILAVQASLCSWLAEPHFMIRSTSNPHACVDSHE